MEISDRKIIWGLIVLQIVVCLPFINSFPIALDEPFSIFYAQQDLVEFIPVLNSGNNSPLHFMLLHFWIRLFGISAIAVRLLSLVISCFVIYFFFDLCRNMMPKTFSALAVLTLLFSNFFHYHSLEIRMYMLFALFFLLIMHELSQLNLKKNKSVLLLIVWNTLLFYTHYLALFVFFTEFLLFFFYLKQFSPFLKKIVTSFFAIAVLCGPGLSVLIDRLSGEIGISTWVPMVKYSELYGNIVRFFNHKFAVLSILAILIVILLLRKANLGTIYAQVISDKYIKFYAIFFLVPYLSMFAFSFLVEPVFLDRYLLFTCIPLFILFALVVSKMMSDRTVKWSFLLVVPLLLSLNFVPKTNRDLHLITRDLNSENYDHASIYVSPPWIFHSILYHFDIESFKDYSHLPGYSVIRTFHALEEVEKSDKMAILISGEGWIKGEDLDIFFESRGYQRIERRNYNALYILSLYSKK